MKSHAVGSRFALPTVIGSLLFIGLIASCGMIRFEQVGKPDYLVNKDMYRLKAAPAYTGFLHGVNVDYPLGWGKFTTQSASARFTAQDAAAIANAGFDHIRLPVFTSSLWPNAGRPDQVDEDAVKAVGGVIRRARAAGLNVVLDLFHDAAMNKTIASGNGSYSVQGMAQFYPAVLTALMPYMDSPSHFWIELMNEPPMREAQLEATYQVVIPAIRTVCPNSQWTLLLSTPDGGQANTFAKIGDASLDSNVVYSIHFYEPFAFTHQGVTFSEQQLKGIKILPFGVSGAKLQKAITKSSPDPKVQSYTKYVANTGLLRDDWTAGAVRSYFGYLLQNAQEAGVNVYVGEVGAHANGDNLKYRAAYLSAVSSAMDKVGIGWSIWDWYDNDPGENAGFQIFRRMPNGEIDPITPLVDALGLTKK